MEFQAKGEEGAEAMTPHVYTAKRGVVRVYRCDGCGKLFEWNAGSAWLGRERDADDEKWDKITFACSQECRSLLDGKVRCRMKHDEAIERVQNMAESCCTSSNKENLSFEDELSAKGDFLNAKALDTLLADCDRYADALVRQAQAIFWWCIAIECERGQSADEWACRLCERHHSVPTRIKHSDDCPVGIGLAIIEEREKHGQPKSG